MDAHRLPIVATLIAAGIALSVAADRTESSSLIRRNNGLRGIGGRRLQDGAGVIVPLLTMTGGLSRCQGDW